MISENDVTRTIYTSPLDPYFEVVVLAATPNPQQVAWVAMHQCYAEGAAYADPSPPESQAGELCIKHLLAGGKGHFSPLEANSITFNIVGFPHSVIQQLRTHRVAVSYSVQSGRYTGKRICEAATAIYESWGEDREACLRLVEGVCYLRPPGNYHDRQGAKYSYSQENRSRDLNTLVARIVEYSERIAEGYSEEHARGLFPFDIRQNAVVTFNARSLMHVLDLRYKKDAQLEIQELARMLLDAFRDWMPEIGAWYADHRALKARLSP